MKLAKNSQPDLYESDIYLLWEKSGAFKPSGSGRGYSLVVPPTNANGNLHMGHALAFSLQDIAARYHRAKGERVLFVPGSDHAGFETQVVYERELEKQGKSRFDYSREALYDQIYDFVNKKKDDLQNQIRKLGASVDWSSYSFSLDEPVIRRAYATFHSMWEEGLIYRGERLVNFCTFHGTAFADIEVEYREEQGFLWKIRYPLTDGSGDISVATTRPETMLGDTAVAVNPKDKRYAAMIGKTVKLPLTHREIPVIGDDYVDMKFGTGAVKITPAHDPNDYEVAARHDLPFVTVIGFDGRFNHNVPEDFQNLTVIEGREAVLKALQDQGYLSEAEDYVHSVGHCYKCGTVIEPLLLDQWFIKVKPLAEKALKSLREGEIALIPKSKLNQLQRYLENLKDWNISRQIAWGIPIPAFVNEEDPGDWIYDERVDQEVITVNNIRYRRDPDVFDTWFSSSSWPYVTLGYPDAQNFKDFYPLSLMETGFDILAQWVSRMIMMGLYVTGVVPFKTVYLHGMVTDERGRKMSKSVGNVIDPMEIISRGADALRIGMITGQTAGNNQPVTPAKFVGGSNFCNKLWNIARFIEGKAGDLGSDAEPRPQGDADHWILARYETTRRKYLKLMDGYRFSEGFELVYHFIWDDLADWYIEASKSDTNGPLLSGLLKAVLVLVHPFAPFLSETIWQTLELKKDSLLSGHPLIELPHADAAKARNFEAIREMTIEIRSLIKATGAKNVTLGYNNEPIVANMSTLIKQLSGVDKVEEGEPGQGMLIPNVGLNAWLDIDEEQLERYSRLLDEEIDSLKTNIERLKGRLNNSSYVDKAPQELVSETREQLAESEQNLENYLQERARFPGS